MPAISIKLPKDFFSKSGEVTKVDPDEPESVKTAQIFESSTAEVPKVTVKVNSISELVEKMRAVAEELRKRAEEIESKDPS